MPLKGLLRRNHGAQSEDSERNGLTISTVTSRQSQESSRAKSGSRSATLPRPVSHSGRTKTEVQLKGTRSAPTTPDAESGTSNGAPRNSGSFRLGLGSRNASDTQLSSRVLRQQVNDESPPPVPKLPAAPAIITTAPTLEPEKSPKKTSRMKLPNLRKHASNTTSSSVPASQRNSFAERRSNITQQNDSREGSVKSSRVTFDEPRRSPLHMQYPPGYAERASSELALPMARKSDSSKSEGSADYTNYPTAKKTQNSSPKVALFKLPKGRRKKRGGPLFPLPDKVSASQQGTPEDSPRTSMGTTISPAHTGHALPSPLPSPSKNVLAATSLNFAAPGTAAVLRKDSTASTHSSKSTPSLIPPGRAGRSSTAGSSYRDSEDLPIPTPPIPSGRTSTSTAGRSSFGGILHLSQRLRNNSEPPLPRYSSPGTPGSATSKSASFNLIRDQVALPERQAEDTPAKYLARIEESVPRSAIAGALSRSLDMFFQNVLRSYMRSFAFFEDPMDMAIRKLLMEVELPKETQQIDRVLQSFADRYHECNPGIFASPEQAYFVAFSLLILHTDVFNKNNKHKMQRQDYLKNTKGEGISDDILECFYDNISYTPFIHVEDDVDPSGDRFGAGRPRKSKLTRGTVDNLKKAQKEPVDPYNLIIEKQVSTLRPNLKDVMNVTDTYNYLGTANTLDVTKLQRSFSNCGVLQVISARSRPDAFMSPSGISNPEDAHPGVVDIKVTKVGILWRKDAKKKKTRSPWQEWGAILTGTQLYLFRNLSWVKSLIHQYESHSRSGLSGAPVTFQPPVENLKPDSLMSTQDAVALLDASYKKHKNAFVFFRHGGVEETFLADSENEMNDWLAKLNYAATFRTTGVRVRGFFGGNYDGQKVRGIRRMDTSTSSKSVQSPTGEVSIVSGKIDVQLAQQIRAARRQVLLEKLDEAAQKLEDTQKELDDVLRNARHLQILAPIEPRTREHVVLAAGRVSAQIKWKRTEIWRRKCYKDILTSDLEDEAKSNNEALSTSASTRASRSPAPQMKGSPGADLHRLNTKSSGSPLPHRYPPSPNSGRPATQSSTKDKDYGMEDLFKTASDANALRTQSWELPPLSFNPAQTGSESVPSIAASRKSPRPESIGHQSSTHSIAARAREASVTDSVRLVTRTPTLETEEDEMLREAGYVDPDTLPALSQTSEAGSDTEEKFSVAHENKDSRARSSDGHDRTKVRRSLHRTLRDAHVPTHHRSKKGKDSASTLGPADDGTEKEREGLSRATGSFTVHGKKASVINFGSEWQNMSPDERLKMRKQAQSEEYPIQRNIVPAEDENAAAISNIEATSAPHQPATNANVENTASPQPDPAPVTKPQDRFVVKQDGEPPEEQNELGTPGPSETESSDGSDDEFHEASTVSET